MSNLPKIYISCEECREFTESHYMIAETASQEVLAGHISSSHEWGKLDMGIGSPKKHDLYEAKYPGGYELVYGKPPGRHELQDSINTAANNHKKTLDELKDNY